MSMKKLIIAGFVLALGASSGCEHMSNTAKGGLIGGGVGAGLGGIAGGGKGALVGGLIGTGVGGLVGNDMDQQEKRAAEHRLANAEARAAANTLPPPVLSHNAPLGMADVMQLSREGRSDTVIINQIRATNSTFQLSVEDIRMLGANGVSDGVIAEMQRCRPSTRVIREPARVIYTDPNPPVVIYERYPPPPRPYTTVGVGVYSHR